MKKLLLLLLLVSMLATPALAQVAELRYYSSEHEMLRALDRDHYNSYEHRYHHDDPFVNNWLKHVSAYYQVNNIDARWVRVYPSSHYDSYRDIYFEVQRTYTRPHDFDGYYHERDYQRHSFEEPTYRYDDSRNVYVYD